MDKRCPACDKEEFLDNSSSCSNYCMTLFVSKALISRSAAAIVGIVSLN